MMVTGMSTEVSPSSTVTVAGTVTSSVSQRLWRPPSQRAPVPTTPVPTAPQPMRALLSSLRAPVSRCWTATSRVMPPAGAGWERATRRLTVPSRSWTGVTRSGK